jgi:hypothetical protein
VEKILLIMSITSFAFSIAAQESCKVLTEVLQGTYQGECKGGLAHGDGIATGLDTYEGHFSKGLPNGYGTYKWNTGAVYVGQWKKGKRQGRGKYTCILNGKEVIQDGLWKNNSYQGPAPAKPYIIRQINVDKVISQYLGEGNTIFLRFFYGGSPVKDPTGSQIGLETQMLNLVMEGSSGTEFFRTNEIGYENVDFPFTIKMTYNSYNQIKTMSINCLLEMRIDQPGTYRIQIHNMGMSSQGR